MTSFSVGDKKTYYFQWLNEKIIAIFPGKVNHSTNSNLRNKKKPVKLNQEIASTCLEKTSPLSLSLSSL